MKTEQWERDIQGGNLCNVCGAIDPCGNIYNCGWWTSNSVRQKQLDTRCQEPTEEEYGKYIKQLEK